MTRITLSDQFQKIKDNWLFLLIGLIILILVLGGSSITNFSKVGMSLDRSYAGQFATSEMASSYDSGYYLPPISSQDFAPDVQERKIIKNTQMTSEVERGKFKESERKVINIATSSNSFILNQRSNKNGKGKKIYYTGYYTIKVETSKYESVVAQLKDIGDVISFTESQTDVTGRYENAKIETDTEKAKLARYESLFDETKDVEQKIQLTDRIFNQERRIKYLEDSLININSRVDYSAITLTLNEERSDYADIAFLKFSALIKSFVGSLNSLLQFFFWIIPWAVGFLIIRFLYMRIKRKDMVHQQQRNIPRRRY